MNPVADPLERTHEVDRIAAALDAAAGGDGCLVVIEGPAGIGKTRLVQEARRLARARGFGRIQATGDELESSMPWSVVRQLVERSIARYGGEDRKRLMAGPSGAALAALSEAPSEAPAGDAALARTLHALWWVAADLASFRPLLITVDDAQWADLPSLRFLDYLSCRIADLPIAVVIGTRPSQDRSGPLSELSAARNGERILPRPLSPDAVAALSVRHGVAPAARVAAAIHVASGGNPLLAGLLIDELDIRGLALDDPGTAVAVAGLGSSAIFGALLARLPPEAIALADGAAVLGTHSEPRVAGNIVGVRGAALAAATDALVAGHILLDDQHQLIFVHPAVREAVLGQIGPGERASLHARAAATLHAAGAAVTRVAAHLALSPIGTLPEAAAVLRQAATVLLWDGDAVTAAGHLAHRRRATGPIGSSAPPRRRRCWTGQPPQSANCGQTSKPGRIVARSRAVSYSRPGWPRSAHCSRVRASDPSSAYANSRTCPDTRRMSGRCSPCCPNGSGIASVLPTRSPPWRPVRSARERCSRMWQTARMAWSAGSLPSWRSLPPTRSDSPRPRSTELESGYADAARRESSDS